jgi:hypothetical protein
VERRRQRQMCIRDRCIGNTSSTRLFARMMVMDL